MEEHRKLTVRTDLDLALKLHTIFKNTTYHNVLCLVAQSCLTLCDPMNCSPPGSSVHGILQARILEWVAISSSRGSFRAKDWTHIHFCTAGRFFTTSITWETWCLCWTLLKANCSICSAWNDLPPASGEPECRCDPLGKIPEESRRPLLQLTRHSMFRQETKTPCTILGPYDIEC